MKNKDEIIEYNYKDLTEVDKGKIELMKKVVERALSDDAIKEYLIDSQINNQEANILDFVSYSKELANYSIVDTIIDMLDSYKKV